MAELILENINKVFANQVKAVNDFNLKIKEGEFIVLVGPSGCGKTTTLRMIAGLESITSGKLYLNDKLINNLAPKDRDMAMVFQNYALYAHMSVYHNMAFSLTLRKENSDTIHERVIEAAEMLELIPYLNRKPKQLSGGQRQRVALGRAIVRKPQVFLLDEPLSNLDAKLRGSMRKELAALHKKLNITFIYVTHDQVEALTLADRMVVMKDGFIQQVGTPKDIYDFPNNLFVATFIGSPPMSLIRGKLNEKGEFEYLKKKYTLSKEDISQLEHYRGKEIVIGIRPEDFSLTINTENSFEVEIDVVEYLGAELLLTGKLGNEKIIAKVTQSNKILPHQKFYLSVKPNRIHFFDPITTNRINQNEVRSHE